MYNPGRIALVSEEEQLTYAELIDLSDSLSSNVPRRSVVFLVASNTIPAVAAYVGFIRRNAVVMMIRADANRSQFESLLRAYEPQFIWAPDQFAEDMGFTYTLKAFDRGYGLYATGFESYEVHEETALLLSTSGSTGTPKYVRLSYNNLRSNALSIAEYQGITPADCAITTLPFSYTYGISIINSHLMSGASVALTESSVMTREFWSFLSRVEATNFGGVPYTYSMLERLRFARMDLPSLRFISQAGGRLGERLQKVFADICSDKGIDFFVMYGQTEATARMSWLPPREAARKLGSIGIAIPSGSFELRDAEGAMIEKPGLPGELVYRGPNVSLGYATGKADLALGDENAGVLHTGDIAMRDDEGFYYVVGRMKRFLKMFGNRVNMDEIESIMGKEGFEVACVGEDDAMVVFTTNDDTGEVLDALASMTGIHPSGFDVRYVDSILRTDSGKINYAGLEKLC